MHRQQIDDYVTRCQELVQRAPDMNEETTKVRLVQPFLELLGWDCHSTAVELEYTVPMASGRTRVDYALVVGDSPAVFVEAKAARSELTDENIQQLKSYMRQELAVEWGVLTNGKSFEVLTKRSEQHRGGEVSVVRFDLGELREEPDVLDLLSKESIVSDDQPVPENSTATGNTVHDLVAKETTISATIAKLVEEEVGHLPLDLESRGREFVQQLATELREHEETTGGSRAEGAGLDKWFTDGCGRGSRTSQSLPEPDAGRTPDQPVEQGYVTSLSDGTTIPGPDESQHITQRQNMTAVVEHLFDEYDLGETIDLPYSLASSDGHCTINVVSRHPDGTPMKDPYTLRDGLSLRTLLGTEEKRARLQDLAARAGHSVEFRGKWAFSPQSPLEVAVRS